MTIDVDFSDNGSIAFLRLNRPLKRNALDRECLEALIESLMTLKKNTSLRVLIFSGHGADFCAGADLTWMKESIQYTKAQNVEDAKQLSVVLELLQTFPRPTIGAVQGAVFGAGMGLVACCDIVLASAGSKFCFSEVKLGLIPAIIGPFMADVMGIRQMQRYCLTAEIFGADEARRCRLVHEIVAETDLINVTFSMARRLLQHGPQALQEAKAMLQQLRREPKAQKKLIDEMVQKIAEIRVGEEAQEGMSAFLEKRDPHYV